MANIPLYVSVNSLKWKESNSVSRVLKSDMKPAPPLSVYGMLGQERMRCGMRGAENKELHW